MPADISIKEFESAVTTLTVTRKLISSENRHVLLDEYTYGVAQQAVKFAVNDILKSRGFDQYLWATKKGARLFLMSRKNNRIAAEIGIITDVSDHRGLRCRVRVELVGHRGRAIKEKTIGELMEAKMKLETYEGKR